MTCYVIDQKLHAPKFTLVLMYNLDLGNRRQIKIKKRQGAKPDFESPANQNRANLRDFGSEGRKTGNLVR